MVAHLCPPTAIRWKARASHPSKPCRARSALAGRDLLGWASGFSATLYGCALGLPGQDARQWGSWSGCSFNQDEERDRTGSTCHHSHHPGLVLVLRVLERHLWLTMTEMKEADLVPFLDAPVSSGSLFWPAVEGFAERFTEAQKSSQAMRHFLPKRNSSSSASSRLKSAPNQQTAKSAPTSPEPRPLEERWDRGRSCSVRRYNFPKRQGPRPKIALDPAPKKSSCSARQKEEGPKSRYRRTNPTNFLLRVSRHQRRMLGAEKNDSIDDSRQNKTNFFLRREQTSFSPSHKRPALMQPVCTAVSTRACERSGAVWRSAQYSALWACAPLSRSRPKQTLR